MKKSVFGATLVAVLVCGLTACGGGGGGGGATEGSGNGPGVGATGLLPAAPALGATLYADATTLRPVRDQAAWTYAGTATAFGGRTVSYSTTTRQSVAADGTITESTTNSGNEGADSQVVRVSGGVVSSSTEVDFTGRGTPETLQVIELRSPVRQGDQYVILDKRYADTTIDADGDGRTDALDVAVYARVVGNETVAPDGLPALTALRVDVVAATRVIFSRNGQPSEVVQARTQAWYAPGIGLVRSRGESPVANAAGVDTVDEILSGWDGITTGYGSLPTRVPSREELAGEAHSQGSVALYTFPTHALLVSRLFNGNGDFLSTRYDLRGQVLGTVVTTVPQAYAISNSAQLDDAIALLLQGSRSGQFSVTLLNTDGSLQGGAGTATIDLNGSRSVPSVGEVLMAGAGDRFWLLWTRGYRETTAPFAFSSETVLRPFNRLGQPLADERVIENRALSSLGLVARGSRVLLTSKALDAGADLTVTVLDSATGALTRSVAFASLPAGTAFVSPFLTDNGAALVWSSGLGGTVAPTAASGLRLDASFAAVRSGNGPEAERVPGLPTYDSSTPAPASVGSRLVLTTADAGTTFPTPPASVGLSRVSWLDVPATGPLNAAPVSAVRFALNNPRAQAVYADRALVFGPGGSVTVVFLNSGRGG